MEPTPEMNARIDKAHEIGLELLDVEWPRETFSEELRRRLIESGERPEDITEGLLNASIRVLLRHAIREERHAKIYEQATPIIHEVDRLIQELPDWDTTTDLVSYHHKLGYILGRHEQFVALSSQIGFEESEEYQVQIEQIRAVWVEIGGVINEVQRAERIAHRQALRTPEVVMEGRKCSACRRKPARVDDLCKKCAYKAGIMVHGKV